MAAPLPLHQCQGAKDATLATAYLARQTLLLVPLDTTLVNMCSPIVIAWEEVVKRLRANMQDNTPEWE